LSPCESAGMKAYSEDIRLRVSAAYDRGMLRKEVSKTFGVSVSTIKRYLKLREQIPFAGRVVAMDDLGAHKTEMVRELIEGRGCQLWFLPAYSRRTSTP
jgi:hypothetical protein